MMAQIIQIITLLAPLFSIVLIGYISGVLKGRVSPLYAQPPIDIQSNAQTGATPEHGLVWLQFFLIYIALPPVFFKLMADKPFSELLHGSFIIGTTLATALIYMIGLLFGLYATPHNKGESVMQALACSFSNVVYLGPPIVVGILGSTAAVPVALIIVFDNLFLFIATPMLMAIVGAGAQTLLQTTQIVALRVITHPFNVATALGLLASYTQFHLPQWMDKMLTSLALAAPPCALFLLGVTLALRTQKRIQREVLWIVPLKLIAHPLMVWVVLSLIGTFSATWVFSAMIMAALPPALNVFVLARHYDTGIDRASACVLIGTIISVFTLTFLLTLIKMNILPVDLWP